MQRGVADEPLAECDLRKDDLLAVLDRHFDVQLARGLVEQEDAERAIVHQPAGELGDPREQLVQVEHGGDLAADIGQGLERLGVLLLPFEQARVDDGGRGQGGELAEDVGVPFRVAVALPAEHVQGANRLRLVHERHGERRHHAGHDLDVVRIVGHIADDGDLLGGYDTADEPLAEADPKLPHVRIAHGVGDSQLVPPFVQQVERERVERDETPDESGHRIEQLVELDDRRHLTPHVEERQQDVALARPVGERRGERRTEGLVHGSRQEGQTRIIL